MSTASRSTVVITWAEGISSLCAVRSLARKGVKVVATSSNPHATGFYSRYVVGRILLPSYTTQYSQYKEALLRLCKRNDILTVMAFTECDAYILCTYRDELTPYVKTLWPCKETFEHVRDRTTLLHLAQDAGVCVPRTRKFSDWKDWSAPCVIKSRYSVIEIDNGLLYHPPIYISANKPPDRESIILKMKHDPIVQERIIGPEYGFFALFNEGKMRASFQHQRIISQDYRGGASVLRKSVYSKELEDLGTRLLQSMKWHGPAMVEFKLDVRDGKFKLMEINPRFWRSLNLAVEAGVNFPYLCYIIAKTGDCEPVYDYKQNIFSQYLVGEIQHFMKLAMSRTDAGQRRPSMLGEMRTVLRTLRYSKFDVLDRRDPAPAVMDLPLLAIEASKIHHSR